MIIATHGIIANSVPLNPLNNGLVAVYKAENNANDSLGVYNGSALGGLTYATGKSGQAFNFNGTTSYVDVGDNFDLGLSSWTYSLWIYPTNVSFAKGIFSKTSWNAGAGRLFMYISSGLLICGTTVDSTNSIAIRENAFNLNVNTWYHLVMVVDRSDKIKMYANGNLLTNIVNVGAITNNLIPYATVNMDNSFPFNLGCLRGTGSNPNIPADFFQGLQDEVSIWNRVLTPTEITQLYNSGSGKFYPY